MAITLTELLVVLGGDSSDLDKDLDGASKTTTNWAASLGGTVTKLVGGAIVGGAAAAAAGLATIGVAAFNVSRETEAAANDIAASLGIPIDEAERFADVAKRVYGNNFAGSIGEAGEAITLLTQQLGELSDADLQSLTEKAFSLKDVFDIEVNESVDAAKTLMENFGVSAEEAFDLITAGQQAGLNRSGDFLDTIGEYSTQFANGGATAAEFFSLLDSGLQGGSLGTDKAADAFKEFRLRINDGSDATRDAAAELLSWHDDIDTVFDGLEDGSLTAIDVFGDITDALGNIDDPVERMRLGTALLGTQFEDLGDSVVTALDATDDAFKNVEGATDSLNQKYADFGTFSEGLWRRAAVAISPLTDRLLDIANDSMPAIEQAFSFFEENAVPAINSVIAIIGGLIDKLTVAKDFILGLFAGDELSEGISANIEILDTFKAWFDDNLPRVQEIVENVLGGIQDFWDEWGSTIELFTRNIFENIKILIDTTLNTILDIVTLGLQLLNGEWEAAGETLADIIIRIWDAIVEIFNNSITAIIDIINNVDWLALGSSIINGLKSGVEAGVTVLIALFDKIASDIKNKIAAIDLKQTGRNIVNGLRSGISEAWTSLTSWFQGQIDSLVNLVPAWLRPGSDEPPPQQRRATSSSLGQQAAQAIDLATNAASSVISLLAIPDASSALSRQPALATSGGGDTIHITINADIGKQSDWAAVARTVSDEIQKRRRRS